MIQDLHSHTYYSFCGKDSPEDVVNAAIDGGIELFGICDHNYGIGYGRGDLASMSDKFSSSNYERNIKKYFDHIDLIKQKYANKIIILRGLEIATTKQSSLYSLPPTEDISYFDYCLIEHLDYEKENTETMNDLFSYAKRCGCSNVGIAHTDMFAFIKRINETPLDYFKKMAEQNIFWEMNVNYDSIHNFRKHQYVIDFFESEEQQDIIRKSGVALSVGFDGHKVEEYKPERVKEYCKKISELGIPLVFE